MRIKRLAVPAVIAAAVLWGILPLFVRYLTAYGLGSLEICLLRSLSGAVLMLPVILIIDPKLLWIRLRHLWYFLGTGIGSLLFFNVCYFYTVTITSMAVASILLYTAPIIVTFLSVLLFKEKLTKRKLIALALAVGGCVLVSGIGGKVSPVGILTGLGAGFGYALYSIFGRYALRDYGSVTVTFYTFLFAAVGGLFLVNWQTIGTVAAEVPSAFLLAALMGLVSTVLPYLLYTFGLGYISPGRASVIACVEPLTAALVGAVVYKEGLSLWQISGIISIIAALLLLAKNNDGGD